MKAFTKFCLIFSGILAVLGCGLLLAAVAMGVSFPMLLDLAHYPTKFTRERIDSIDQVSDALEHLDDGLEHLDDALEGLDPDQKDSARWGEKHYEFDDISGLDFELSLCKLEIRQHDGDTVILDAENTKDYFQYMADGILWIGDDRPSSTLQNGMDNALTLTLTLPKRKLESVHITLDTGTVSIDSLDFDEMVLDNDIGELDLNSLSGNSFTLTSGVSDCDIDGLSIRDSCHIEAGTGDIRIDRYEGTDLNLDCSIGEVDLTAVGKASDYNYDLQCDAGEIHCNGRTSSRNHHQEHEDHDGLGCSMKEDHGASRALRIQCGLGDLTLNFTQEDL